MSLVRGSGKGGAGASIAEDMYFASTAERDQFTTDNPSRIFQGVTCAVTNASVYDYYQYDLDNTQWRDANLIFQGKKGDQGEAVSVGDGTGSYSQVNKINFDEGLLIEVVGDVATVVTEKPAKPNLKSVDGVEPDVDGNVQIDALRGRINVTNVDNVAINPGDGVTIEGVLADGGYSIYKYSQGTRLDGICLDKRIEPSDSGLMAVDGVFSAVELGVDAPFVGAKIIFNLQTSKAETVNFIKDKSLWLGDVTDDTGEVNIDCRGVNSQIQSDYNASYDLERYINVVNPDQGKSFDGLYVFKTDDEKAKGYQPVFTSPAYDSSSGLGVQTYKPNSTAIVNGLAYGFKYESPPYYQHFYLVIADERLKDIQLSGKDIGYSQGKLEYGLAFGSDAMVSLAFSTLNVNNPTYGSKVNSSGYWIPNISPDDGSIIDPNDKSNTHFLNKDGDLTDFNGAYFNGYIYQRLVQIQDYRGQNFGYSLKRGFLYRDPSDSTNVQFIPSANSDYFVIPAGSHRLGISGDTEMALYVDWGKTKIFNSGIEAALYREGSGQVAEYSNVLTYSNDGNSYVDVNKTYPAECVGDIKLGHVVQIVAPLTVAGVPAVKEVSSGTIISGVALSNGSDQDIIMILEKGTYDNEVVKALPRAVAGDIVYVDSDGALSLKEFDNTPIGYIMESKNVFIDNDLYNAKFANYVKPSPSSVDVVFWWTENAEPTAEDITNALGQVQTDEIMSHTDNFKVDDLQKRTMTARRDENEFKYAYFAWPKGFFNPEPTKVNTGWGEPSTWLETEVSVDGVEYKVLTVEVRNNVQEIEDYGLVQEGIR